MSTKSPIILKKHTIWYKFEDRHPSSLRQLPGSDFTSLLKQAEPDSAFITLNDDYFRNQLNSSFKHLVEKFGIKTYNPIIVTLLDSKAADEKIRELEEQIANLQMAQGTIRSPGSWSVSSSTESVQAPPRIWFRMRGEDQAISFSPTHLNDIYIVDDLKEVIKDKLELDVPKNRIIIYKGETNLKGDIFITGLYNQIDEALEIVIKEVETMKMVVTADNKEFYFENAPRTGSPEEIIKFINSIPSLKPLIVDCTVLGDDYYQLSEQHIKFAQKSGGCLKIILSKPGVIDTGFETHRITLEEAFSYQFKDPHGMKKNFMNYLNEKHKAWKRNINNYVPYSTIFQSSGYGKSRLIKETAKTIPTIYICLRDPRSTGYPPRTSVGADLFERVLGDLKEEEEWKFLYVLQNAILCFKEELKNSTSEELWNNQMDASFCERIWTDIQKKSETWRNISFDAINSSNNLISDDNTDDVHLLFCIDEARTLLSQDNYKKISLFRFFRRALRHITWNGFFVMFLDTLSRISNFAPPKSADPSGRDDSNLPLKLFYPYFRLTTMDILKSDDNEYNEHNEYFNLAKFGRPLYFSYLQSCKDNTQAIGKLKNLLSRKLLGGANSFKESQQEISSLAILSSVIGIDMSPQSRLTSELVASHMTTCLALSEDRERLIIAYPSEPLLSEVALEFMSDSTLPEILKQFNSSLKKGLVEPGPRGEIVSRIILAVVAHNLKKKGSVNSVKDFLTELYHEDSTPDLTNFSDDFIDGSVAFTHFNAVSYVPERKDLENFYKRRCAFIMKRNHPGADICIPVRMKTGEKYSVIIIQIKNISTSKTDQKYPASAQSMLNCDYVFEGTDLKNHTEPCLCLYWQLGYKQHYQESHSSRSTRSGNLETKNLYWVTFGLTHYKIEDNIADILRDMLTSYVSPFDSEWIVNNEEGDNWDDNELKIMHPLRYEKYKEEEENQEKEEIE
ncbi:hypothetical protein RhiirA1_429196 [Rhizophagus irregularis]|uniref:Uncharacterized protein n=1 Tax=Rhizophagus irregularis TaxID=588596 RepID=A0A2I1FAJ7_9GLOM|nr:hypothetical protein RhiirA1_429196 [Rhizophagus irregularis]PKY31367.1 hypothetical protein RhiirB3_419484 [Rhizophagus irregularis]